MCKCVLNIGQVKYSLGLEQMKDPLARFPGLASLTDLTKLICFTSKEAPDHTGFQHFRTTGCTPAFDEKEINYYKSKTEID